MTTPVHALPSLENGDHMDREEFHRRYELRPDIRRAELVEGVVHVPSPMRIESHDRPALLCATLLELYATRHPGVLAGAGGTVLLGGQSEVQPDAYLWREGGDAALDARDYLVGAPGLVVEVAASTVSYDLHEKREAYRRAGVCEYVVWRVLDRSIDFFRLDDGEYIEVDPGADRVFESKVFPGLRFDVARMLADDRTGVYAALG